MDKKNNKKKLWKLGLLFNLSFLPLTTLVSCFDFTIKSAKDRKKEDEKKDLNNTKDEPVSSKTIFPNKNDVHKNEPSKNDKASEDVEKVPSDNNDDLSPETINNSIANHLLDYEKINTDNVLQIVGLNKNKYQLNNFEKNDKFIEIDIVAKNNGSSYKYQIAIKDTKEIIDELTKDGGKLLREKEILTFAHDANTYILDEFQDFEHAKNEVIFRSFNGFTFNLDKDEKITFNKAQNIVFLPIIARKDDDHKLTYKLKYALQLVDKKETYKIKELLVEPKDNLDFVKHEMAIKGNKPINFKEFLIKYFGLKVDLNSKINTFKQIYKTNYNLDDFTISSMVLKEDLTTNVDYLEIKMDYKSDPSFKLNKLVPLYGLTSKTNFSFANIRIKDSEKVLNVKRNDINLNNYEYFFSLYDNTDSFYADKTLNDIQYDVLEGSFKQPEEFKDSWSNEQVQKYINSKLYANIKVKIIDKINKISVIRDINVFPYKWDKPEIKATDQYFDSATRPKGQYLSDIFNKNQEITKKINDQNFISALKANDALKNPFLNNFDQNDLNADNFETFVSPLVNPLIEKQNFTTIIEKSEAISRFNVLFSPNYHRYYYDFRHDLQNETVSFKIGFVSRLVPEFRFRTNVITFRSKFKNDFRDNFDLKQQLSSINFSNVYFNYPKLFGKTIGEEEKSQKSFKISDAIVTGALSFYTIDKENYNIDLTATQYDEDGEKFFSVVPALSKSTNSTYYVPADTKYIILSEKLSINDQEMRNNRNSAWNSGNNINEEKNRSRIKRIVDIIEKDHPDLDDLTVIFPKKGQYIKKKLDLTIEDSQFLKEESGFSWIIDKKYLNLANLGNEKFKSYLDLQFPLSIKNDGKTFIKTVSIRITNYDFDKDTKPNLITLVSEEDPSSTIQIQTTLQKLQNDKLKIKFLSPENHKFEYTSLPSQKTVNNEFLVNQLWVKVFSKIWVEDKEYFNQLDEKLNNIAPIGFIHPPELNNFKQAMTLKNVNLDNVNINSADPLQEGKGFIPDFQQLNEKQPWDDLDIYDINDHNAVLDKIRQRTFFSNGTLTMLSKVDPGNYHDKRYYFITNRHVAMGVSKNFNITAGDSYINSIQVIQDVNNVEESQRRFFVVDNIKFNIEWDATKQISKDLKIRDNEEDILIGIIDVKDIMEKAKRAGAYKVVEFFKAWDNIESPLTFAPTDTAYPINTTPKHPLVKSNKYKLPGYLLGFPNARYSELEVNRLSLNLDEGQTFYRLGEKTIALSKNSLYGEIKYQGLRKMYLLQGSSGTLFINRKGEIVGILSAGLNEEKQYFALIRLMANPVFDYIGTSESNVAFNRVVNVNSFYNHLNIKTLSHAGYSMKVFDPVKEKYN